MNFLRLLSLAILAVAAIFVASFSGVVAQSIGNGVNPNGGVLGNGYVNPSGVAGNGKPLIWSSSLPVAAVPPLYPTKATSSYAMADSLADSLGVDTNISQGPTNNPTADYGFTTQASYLCGNFASVGSSLPWSQSFNCFRHIRDGAVVGNGSPHDPDINLLATNYGILPFMQIVTGDTNSQIAAGLLLHAGLEAAAPDNEIDSIVYGMYFTSSTSANSNGNIADAFQTYPASGSTVIVGEGPSQETAVIDHYANTTHFGGANVYFTSPLSNAHNGGINTTLSVAISGPTPATGVVPPTPPVTLPLPPYPGTTPTPGTTTTITLANRTGIQPGDYLTLGCFSVNNGNDANSEVVQVSSSYTASTGAGTVPLVTAPVWAHSTSEYVVEGCIRRAPGNAWGALEDEGLELLRAQVAIGNLPMLSVAMAGSQDNDAFLPQYGGFRQPYAAFAITQLHAYCGGSCGGAWGDGTLGYGNNHPYCFLLSCNYASWQWDMSGAYSVGGIVKPVWCTECGWSVVPVGAHPTSSPTNYGNGSMVPDDVGAVWAVRGPLWQLNHGMSRVYTFQLTDDAGGFCMFGLVRTTGCGGSTGYGLSSGTNPKASYYALTDLIGLMTDSGCKVPGCGFKPDSITWAWTSLPSTSHGSNYQGTDPSQIQFAPYEYSNGKVILWYWYEGVDYLQSQPTSNPCVATTYCYQWSGQAANSSPNADNVTGYSTNLYVQGAHNWTNCVRIDLDDNPTDTWFGHFIPVSSGLTFSGSDQISVSVKPEPQALYCATGRGAITTVGTPLPSPAPIPSPSGTPEALPSWASPKAIPTAFQ